MSVSEEAGITHFLKPFFKDELILQTVLGETWAFSDICQLHTKPLFLPSEKRQCYWNNTVNHEPGGAHRVMMKVRLEKLTGSSVRRADAHMEAGVCV